MYTLQDILNYGERLIKTEDLDPIYVALYNARLPKEQLYRLLLAYFCFYHLGVSAFISEQEGETFWEIMEIAAKNTLCFPDEIQSDLPEGRWPRGTERRHFRGQKCVDAIRSLKKSNLWGSGILAKDCPQGLVETLMDGYSKPPVRLEVVMGRIQQWPLFGPWIAFKVADMLESIVGIPIEFPTDLTLFYKEPRAAFELLPGLPEDNNYELLTHFRDFLAPPRYERRCGIQEVETICCKWKASTNARYWIGKDIHEVRHGLKGWGETATKLLQYVPREVSEPIKGLFA